MIEGLDRVLVFVAHPDDESIGCSGLLQRATTSLVVFAVDGAPPHYGFERKYGSLGKYSEARFLEASRALSFLSGCSLQRLQKSKERYFIDQHLFEDLGEAYTSLLQITRKFAPDLIVSHAYEGGNIDHDACSFLASKAAESLAVRHLEFPLYWRSESGQDIFQEFRDYQEDQIAIDLSEQEIALKKRIWEEYQTQRSILAAFRPEKERFRPVGLRDYSQRKWPDYPFENRRRRLKADFFLRKIAEFEMAKITGMV